MVDLRGPRSDEESSLAGWSNPQTPCMEAEYSRAGWSSPAARARTLSPTGQAGRPPRPAPGSSVRLGRLVEHRARRLFPPGSLVDLRGPRSDDESRRAGWSNPQTPGMEAEYSRAGWSSPAARASTLSPTGEAGRPPRPESGGSVPLCRLVEPRAGRPSPAGGDGRPPSPGQEAQSRCAGWSTPASRARKLSPTGQACGAPCWEASPAGAPGRSPWPALGR